VSRPRSHGPVVPRTPLDLVGHTAAKRFPDSPATTGHARPSEERRAAVQLAFLAADFFVVFLVAPFLAACFF
jgi:hypothetical protein